MTEGLHGQDGGGQAERFWEEHYCRREQVWSGRPNPVLVEVAGTLPAGTALDLGCGEGGDAVWLAGLGWRVTAVDVSATALGRATIAAASAGVEDNIDFRRHDLARAFPTGTFDLVSAQYLQSPLEFPRDRVLRAAARAVAPGGLLLIVEHGPVRHRASKAHSHVLSPEPEETLATLDLIPGRWRAERLGSPERRATGPNRQPVTATDNVVAVRRLIR
jgi:SAM-dependent methyltransferase